MSAVQWTQSASVTRRLPEVVQSTAMTPWGSLAIGACMQSTNGSEEEREEEAGGGTMQDERHGGEDLFQL